MTGSQKLDVVVGAGSGIASALIHRWIEGYPSNLILELEWLFLVGMKGFPV